MSDFQRKSAKNETKTGKNLTATLFKQYENYSVKNSSSMKYLDSMIAKINLTRADIENSKTKGTFTIINSEYEYSKFDNYSNAGTGTATSRTHY